MAPDLNMVCLAESAETKRDKFTFFPLLPTELQRKILEFRLFGASDSNNPVGVPAVDPSPNAQRNIWYLKLRVLRTGKQVYKEGLDVFYSSNFFRVSQRSIRRSLEPDTGKVNPMELMRKVLLVNDIATREMPKVWLPAEIDVWIPLLFISVPAADPNELYVGSIFPSAALLKEHDVFRFQACEVKFLADQTTVESFDLRHPTLGTCAHIIVARENRILLPGLKFAITSRHEQLVNVYLGYAREFTLKQSALSLVNGLRSGDIGRDDLTKHIYECVTPTGYGIMASKRSLKTILPADRADGEDFLKHLAAPQPVCPSESLALYLLADNLY